MMRVRFVALVLSASLALWLVLALTVAPSLHLAGITIGAAAVIIAVETGALVYALRVARNPVPRDLDHLDWLAQFCQILGLLGTVAGFMLEMRALGQVSTDSSALLGLIAQMSRGLGTAMVTTFAGVLASVAVSLARHSLEA